MLKYERDDVIPSIDMILKQAKAFGVRLDYFLGEGLNAYFDKETLRRVEEMERLSTKERQRIFHYMDLVIRDYKGKQAYGA